jgi:hypothetical protein
MSIDSHEPAQAVVGAEEPRTGDRLVEGSMVRAACREPLETGDEPDVAQRRAPVGCVDVEVGAVDVDFGEPRQSKAGQGDRPQIWVATRFDHLGAPPIADSVPLVIEGRSQSPPVLEHIDRGLVRRRPQRGWPLPLSPLRVVRRLPALQCIARHPQERRGAIAQVAHDRQTTPARQLTRCLELRDFEVAEEAEQARRAGPCVPGEFRRMQYVLHHPSLATLLRERW